MNNIPKSFTLGGIKITTKYSADPTNAGVHGQFDPNSSVVTIFTQNRGSEVNNSNFQNIFWHEAVHAILGTYGYESENGNEQLVSSLASGICQVLQSAEYKAEETQPENGE